MSFGGVNLFVVPGFPFGATGRPVPPGTPMPVPPGTTTTSPPGVAPGAAIPVPVIPAPNRQWEEVHQVESFMLHYLIKRQVNKGLDGAPC